jgi:hypothetical protein
MRIDTRSAAKNATIISVPNEITCGRCISAQRCLPFRFRADRPTATTTSQSGAMQQRIPANQCGRTLHGSTIAVSLTTIYR